MQVLFLQPRQMVDQAALMEVQQEVQEEWLVEAAKSPLRVFWSTLPPHR